MYLLLQYGLHSLKYLLSASVEKNLLTPITEKIRDKLFIHTTICHIHTV